MKVEVNLADETEFLKEIDKLVRERVLSVGRSEITGILTEHVERKLTKQPQYLEDAIKIAIGRWLSGRDWKNLVNRVVDEAFKESINEAIAKKLFEINWDRLIEDSAKHKLKKMIDAQSNGTGN